MIKNRELLTKKVSGTIDLLNLAEKVLNFLQPKNLLESQIKRQKKQLIIQQKIFDLNSFGRIFVVGAGKATYQMADTINELLRERITVGFINVPNFKTKKLGKIFVNTARHPLPDANGQRGAKKILQLVSDAQKDDLVICLISGGGSALLPLPHPFLSLQTKILLTKKLLLSGADINEINIVRKHLSLIKGGRLAQAALPATIISLYISDVIGDDLATIASGPTVADSSTSHQAISILKKYHLGTPKLLDIIKNNETPKKLDNKKVFNFLVGSNKQALNYLESIAQKKFKVKKINKPLSGEAREAAVKFVRQTQKTAKTKHHRKPVILIAGGETTVTVKGSGFGGRNQEFALASLPYLGVKITLLTLATDGVDGLTPYPVAGAIVNGIMSKLGGKNFSKEIVAALKNNNSFTFLNKLGCLIKTGPTGTNVGDIVMLFIKNAKSKRQKMNNRAASGAVSACGRVVIHPADGGVYYLHAASSPRQPACPVGRAAGYSAGR